MRAADCKSISEYASLFERRSGIIPLNNAGFAPLNRQAAEAMQSAIQEMTIGANTLRQRIGLDWEQAHTAMAELVGCDADEITFMPNVANAMSSLALALQFKANDEIVTVDQEYASNAYPWHTIAKLRDARVLRAQSRADHTIDTAEIVRLIGPKTRVVAISWVQFQTGSVIDLEFLSLSCKQHDALLIVDGTQGIGVAPFSMRDIGIDAVVGSLHKWICGPIGSAYLAVNRCLLPKLEPQIVGPYSYGEAVGCLDTEASLLTHAGRFRSGTPSLIPIIGAGAAVRALLDCGVAKISQYSLQLAQALYRGLKEQEHQVLSPEVMTTPIVTFIPRQGLEAAKRALDAYGITYALRAGGLRLSPHAFNLESDVAMVLQALHDERFVGC
ncbi:MAG: aminotransferase class V-fold PLP-dependent enzyme [Proteobacteria bacterium]|nr:aminotransferase class V-fold PLP-dependent enzyme [Pseudomonadota bacterium]